MRSILKHEVCIGNIYNLKVVVNSFCCGKFYLLVSINTVPKILHPYFVRIQDDKELKIAIV